MTTASSTSQHRILRRTTATDSSSGKTSSSTSSMAESFRPLLPSLPSYPSYPSSGFASSRSSKRVRGTASENYTSPPPLSRFYDTPQDPAYVLEDSDNEMGLGVARGGSLIRDKGWRSTLGPLENEAGNRKRGREIYSDDEYEDEDENDRRKGNANEGAPKKRRVIEVVGGLLGKVWGVATSIVYYPAAVFSGATSSNTTPPGTDLEPDPQLEPEPVWNEKTPIEPILSPPTLNTNVWEKSVATRPLQPTPQSRPLQDWVLVPTTPATPSPTSAAAAIHKRATSLQIPRRTRPSPRYKRPTKTRSRPSSSGIYQHGRGRSDTRVLGGSEDSEDEADESIRRFNERLKEMIREGREALGSTVEVYYEDE